MTGLRTQPLAAPRAHLGRLQQLESEGIHIIREAAAQFDKPVMLYSVGKDSSVLVHLARKAFYPGGIPFPLLHIDTTWKFRELIEFRDRAAAEIGFELIVHINQEGLTKGVNPFDQGSRHYTDVMKTQALRQALDDGRWDGVLCGSRRDEEPSRAKERIFSFRDRLHRWAPRNQRPEMWNHFNGRIDAGEEMRVFPLSNWAEIDVWQYIASERIPIVPLYLAAPRPVVERDGHLLMVDDDRFRLNSGETARTRSVRFRTLGCYPLTGAVASRAATLHEVIAETAAATRSERETRVIDQDQSASMERKKREGYF